MTDGKIIPFNPLDKHHLGASVGQAMLRQPVIPMAELTSFQGAGIYAIYYRGDFPAYAVIAQKTKASIVLHLSMWARLYPKARERAAILT